MRHGWRGIALLGAMTAGGLAHAHDFMCEKLVNGSTVTEIDRYPAALHYDFTVKNTHPSLPSTALEVKDPLLVPYGFAFTPKAPFTLGVGGAAHTTFDLRIHNEAECRALDAADGTADGAITNTLIVRFDNGSASCSARAICKSEHKPPSSCDERAGATRGLGFWKNHINAVQACMAAGPVNLGTVTVSTLADFEGIFWGSPARFQSGAKRSDLDQARFLLARETLVATCNVRVFNARPVRPTLLQEAANLIRGTDCRAIRDFVPKVHGFNECNGQKPHGSWGPATPKAAQAVASDPTRSSGQTCK